MYGWIGGEPRVARSSVWERSIDQRVPDQSTTQTRRRRFAKCKVDMDKVTSQPNAKAYCLVGSGALDIRCKWENKCTRQATHLIERDLRARDDGDGDGVDRPEPGPACTLRDKGDAEAGDEREVVDAKRKLRCRVLSARRCCGEQQEQDLGEEESDR